MRADSTVADLHQVLQVAFGWQDVHLHRFEIRVREYGVYRDGGPTFSTDARKVCLRDLKLRLTLLTTELKGPDGLAFTPDERFLYVDNWDAESKVVLRFPVLADGTLGRSTVFADMTRELPGEEALDGMKVDVDGNLYVTAPGGVRIYSAAGKHLGTVRGPKNAHNLAWGGADGRTLYMTALSGLYRMPLLIPGIRP